MKCIRQHELLREVLHEKLIEQAKSSRMNGMVWHKLLTT